MSKSSRLGNLQWDVTPDEDNSTNESKQIDITAKSTKAAEKGCKIGYMRQNLVMPRDLNKQAKLYCTSNEITLSDLVEELLRTHLDKNSLKSLTM